ncbi:MAG: dolichol-phosphate mannosyltransferase [Flavipsychrobacter sp.]|jgi:dolichol-phosphate mannosyltransferase|nr:dolichol-phosphate mannosyltransferase [Flavipsychrobacter sp.]
MHIRIVLPAYNEEESLPPLLQKVNEAYNYYGWDASVLVVNDGSKDNTLAVAQNFKADIKIDVLDIQPNSGLANAINQGMRKAIEGLKDTDIVVTLDADDSQTPFLIQRMAQQVAEGSDLVIASRYQPGARIKGLKKSRTFFSWAAGMLFRIMVGFEGIKDYTCGFRAYRVDMLKKTINYYGDKFITQKGFGCMVEVLLKVASQSATMNEVPMILRYDLKQGESKMNVKKTMRQTLKLLLDYKTGKLKP